MQKPDKACFSKVIRLFNRDVTRDVEVLTKEFVKQSFISEEKRVQSLAFYDPIEPFGSTAIDVDAMNIIFSKNQLNNIKWKEKEMIQQYSWAIYLLIPYYIEQKILYNDVNTNRILLKFWK